MNLTKLNYVDEAEKAIKSMLVPDKRGNVGLRLSTSKIRNILAMVSEIYNEAIHYQEKILSEDILSNLQYLKMRIIYEAGREPVVKEFVQKASVIEHIGAIKNNKENLLVFCKYMESLVAYHKFYGGRD